MGEVAIRYDAAPTVGRYLGSDAFVRCIMGPVGSGKSSGSLMELLMRAQKQARGPDGIRRTRWAAIRNTYGQLRDTTRKTFEEWIPSALGTWNEQQFTFKIKFADVESEVLFRALDRPEDKKKLLSLDLTGAYVNEAREISKDVFDVLQTRVGRYPSKAQGGPTWFGVWMDTNPWHTGHWASKLFAAKPDGHELFRQPGGRSPQAENVENLPPGYYARLCIGKDSEWIRVYVDGEEAASDIGAIFGDAVEALARRGGLAAFPYEKEGLLTAWDLGKSDSTAIWVLRPKADGVDWVDFYQAHGKGMSHYFGVIHAWEKEKGYQFLKHCLPHDARAHTLAAQTSIQDQAITEWGAGRVVIVPNLDILDGIQAARWVLEQSGTRIHPNCADGIDALREYRYAWDEGTRAYSKNPLHTWASHPADGFRYGSVMAKVAELMTRKPAPPKQGPYARAPDSFTLDELWSLAPKKSSRI